MTLSKVFGKKKEHMRRGGEGAHRSEFTIGKLDAHFETIMEMLPALENVLAGFRIRVHTRRVYIVVLLALPLTSS